MEVTTKRKPPFELHADTRILIHVLHKAYIDEGRDFVPYGELNRAIGGRNVQTEAKGLLETARHHVEKEDRIKIVTIRNEGMKVTLDYSGCLKYTRDRVRRALRRESRTIINAMDNKQLPPEQRQEIMAELSLSGAVQLMTAPKMPGRLLEKVKDNAENLLPTAETLRLFLPMGNNGPQ